MTFPLAADPSLAAFGSSFTAITLAELGDKTFFFATAPGFSFVGLLLGTLLGHGQVAGLAVGAGGWIGKRISERLPYRLGGRQRLRMGYLVAQSTCCASSMG